MSKPDRSSRVLLKCGAALVGFLMLMLTPAQDTHAQRSGGGYYRPPPVYSSPPAQPRLPQPKPPQALAPKQAIPSQPPVQPRTPQTRLPQATTPRQGATAAGGAKSSPPPSIKPTAPVASMKGYTGQVTAKGSPIVQVKGQNYQIPQSGVSTSLKSRLLSSTSLSTVQWDASQKQRITRRFSDLALAKKKAAVARAGGGSGTTLANTGGVGIGSGQQLNLLTGCEFCNCS